MSDAANAIGVADRLRLFRQERGWTQAQLARAAGVSPATVSRLELGEERPRESTVRALATALHVEPERLLGLAGQAALFPTGDEQRMDLIRRIVGLTDAQVELSHAELRRQLQRAAAGRPPRPERRRGTPRS